ncbi:MAG: XdhC family protein [Gemmatimonadaceae bacterium]
MYDEFFHKAAELQEAGLPFATATVGRAQAPTSGKPGDRAIVTLDGVMFGWIGGSCAQPSVVKEARRAILEDRSLLLRLSPNPGTEPVPPGMTEVPMTCFSGGTIEVYIEPQQPRPRLIVVGHLPLAAALCHLGKALNYRVIAVAPNEEAAAVAHAHEVHPTTAEIASWLTPLTFVVVATHGYGDEQALADALRGGAPYVGLVASRARATQVRANLQSMGIEPALIEKVKAPAGLDIRARRGDEIALSVMAEIVMVRRGLEQLTWASAEKEPAEDATAIDPVCGMTVKKATAKATHDYNGTTYYFCCPGCRGRFAKNPEQFLTAASN